MSHTPLDWPPACPRTRATLQFQSDSGFVRSTESHTAAASRPQPLRRPPIRLEPRPSWWRRHAAELVLLIGAAASGFLIALPIAVVMGFGAWILLSVFFAVLIASVAGI